MHGIVVEGKHGEIRRFSRAQMSGRQEIVMVESEIREGGSCT